MRPERAKSLAELAKMAHGPPLKHGDRRKVFLRYVRAGENRTFGGGPKGHRDIVDDLGGMRAVGTIHKWMQGDFPEIAAEMAERDGPLEAEERVESGLSRGLAPSFDRGLATATLVTRHAGERCCCAPRPDGGCSGTRDARSLDAAGRRRNLVGRIPWRWRSTDRSEGRQG